MSQQIQSTKGGDPNWKSRTYVIGTAVGALVGMLSAYLFARSAAESSTSADGKPDSIPTSQLLGTALAVISLTRQIAEMGKPRKK